MRWAEGAGGAAAGHPPTERSPMVPLTPCKNSTGRAPAQPPATSAGSAHGRALLPGHSWRVSSPWRLWPAWRRRPVRGPGAWLRLRLVELARGSSPAWTPPRRLALRWVPAVQWSSRTQSHGGSRRMLAGTFPLSPATRAAQGQCRTEAEVQHPKLGRTLARRDDPPVQGARVRQAPAGQSNPCRRSGG